MADLKLLEERLTELRSKRAEIDAQIRAAEAELLPPVSPLNQAAWETFQRDLPQLLKEKPGWWVMYRGAERLGIAKDDMDLYALCDRRGVPRDDVVVWCVERLPEYDTIGCSVLHIGEEPRP